MGGMKPSPPLVSALSMVLGIIFISLLVIPGPLEWGDLDEDGVSDTFQDLEAQSDLVLSPSGEWNEVDIGHTSTMNLSFTIFIGIIFLLLIPILVYWYLSDLPRRREEMEKMSMASAMQDNVRRISSFMSINPSISNATRLSHVSQTGDGEKALGQVIWRSRTAGMGLEQALLGSSRSMDGEDAVITPAIEGLISAGSESTQEEVRMSSEAVVERMNEELKDRMGTYASSLKGPSTALFALGVLLPILLATMIPIAGLSNRTVVMIGSLLWGGVPLMILFTTGRLVLKRPMLPLSGSDPKDRVKPSLSSLFIMITGMVLIITSSTELLLNGDPIIILEGPFPGPISSCFLALLVGTSLLIASGSSMISSEKDRIRKKEEEEMERVPDLLSEMGSQLMEGRSLEIAIIRGFRRIGRDPPLQGRISSLSELDPGPVLRLTKVSSEFASAGGRAGGRSVKALSKHLREMGRLERSMKEMVRSSIGQMEITASIFAPIMVGASVGIFRLMDRSASTIAGNEMIGTTFSRGDLTVPGFIVLAGVYLILLSLTTTLAMYRLEEGVPHGGWSRVPKNVILASFTFTAGVVVSTLLIGG